ncbi:MULTISPECIES: hypothetical protein [unclassified Luteimonas]
MKPHSIARASALAAAGLLLAACTVTDLDAARVDCATPGPHGVDCRIQRTGGNGSFQACWDLVIGCGNGGEMVGAACHEMAAGTNAGNENMPVSGFSNQDSCDVPASGKVERLKVTSR